MEVIISLIEISAGIHSISLLMMEIKNYLKMDMMKAN